MENQIKYFTATAPCKVYEVDTHHRVAHLKKRANGNSLVRQKGKTLTSFGKVVRARTNNGKMDLLMLLNGAGVPLANIQPLIQPEPKKEELLEEAAFADTPKGEDNPPADGTPATEVKPDKSNFIGRKKFDKGAVAGLLIGAVIGGAIMWVATKNKTRMMIGIVAGAILGALIGFFMGRQGIKKEKEGVDLDAIGAKTDFKEENAKTKSDSKNKKSDKSQFLKIGDTYDFALPCPIYAMKMVNNTFYIARDGNNRKIVLHAKRPYTGKLVQVSKAKIFVISPHKNGATKVSIGKPLPMLKVGEGIFIPLSVLDKQAGITMPEFKAFIAGQNNLSEDLFIKGRYAGKRSYNLLYLPQWEHEIRQLYGTQKAKAA